MRRFSVLWVLCVLGMASCSTSKQSQVVTIVHQAPAVEAPQTITAESPAVAELGKVAHCPIPKHRWKILGEEKIKFFLSQTFCGEVLEKDGETIKIFPPYHVYLPGCGDRVDENNLPFKQCSNAHLYELEELENGALKAGSVSVAVPKTIDPSGRAFANTKSKQTFFPGHMTQQELLDLLRTTMKTHEAEIRANLQAGMPGKSFCFKENMTRRYPMAIQCRLHLKGDYLEVSNVRQRACSTKDILMPPSAGEETAPAIPVGK